MIGTGEALAQRLVELASKIAPPERTAWFEAMAAELDHVPAADRIHFAGGCLLVACRERLGSPQFLQAAARSLLIGGALLWAALNIRFAGRMSVSDAVLLEAYGYCTALVFLLGALATARFGFRATTGLAVSLFTVLALAAAFVRLGGETPTATSTLYFALMLENLVVLGFALLVAGAAARFATIQKALN